MSPASTGSFELPNGGGGGVAAVTPEFPFGGVRPLYDGLWREIQLPWRRCSDPDSGSVTLRAKDTADVVRTTLLSARSYPDQARDAQPSALFVRSKETLISSRLSRSSSRECNELKFF